MKYLFRIVVLALLFHLSVSAQNVVISNQKAVPFTNYGAVIKWVTSAGGTSQVEYGATTTYGSTTTLDSTLVVNHLQTIMGLSVGPTYHYRVHSQVNGVDAVSGDYAFFLQSDGTAVPVATCPSIAISPANVTMHVGESVQFSATGGCPASNPPAPPTNLTGVVH